MAAGFVDFIVDFEDLAGFGDALAAVSWSGFFVAFGAGDAFVDFIEDDFIDDFVDFIELDLVVAAFADALGAGDAAIAMPVVRNAAATSDARIFFMCSPPFVATDSTVGMNRTELTTF